MRSFLNEPLEAVVELLDTRDLTVDDIRIRLAENEDFKRLGVERSFFLTSIKFDIEVDEDTGRGRIILSSEESVLEPYLDLIIEARWPSGRLLREYTVLVDPPAFRQEVVTVSASERVEAANPTKPAVAAPPKTETVSSGDSVAMRQSSLPPGEMPERAFSAETASTPQAGNRYMVRRDETLWQIASQGRPSGISVQQAMLDIQRLNPEAFINGNINQIKAGYIIYLPAAGDISSDDLADALDEVRAQNAEWQDNRSAPGVTAAATLRVSAEPTDSGRVSDSDSAAMADTGSDTMEEAVAGSTTTDPMDSMVDDADDAEAPADAAIASSELAAQMDAMAQRLDTLEQIVALKDEQIATLEQALREAREAAAATAAAPAQPAVAAPVTPAPTPQPRPATPEPQGGGIPWLPIGGGLLVALLGVVFFLRRRSAKEEDAADTAGEEIENDVFAGVSLSADALDEEVATEAPSEAPEEEAELEPELPPVAAAPEAEEENNGGSRGYGERKHDDYIDEGAAGDALAEADIYIAYGRYLQAIELLDTAIAEDPKNTAYRLKLLELYVDMGEDESAKDQLEELRGVADADTIARAEALMGGAGEAAPAGFDLEPQDDEFDLDLETPVEDDLPVEESAGDAADDEEESLELDLADDADEDAEISESADSSDAVVSEALEFNLDDAAPDAELEDESDVGEIEFDHLEIEDDIDGEPEADGDLDFASPEEELDLTDALVDTGEPDAAAASDDDDTEEELLIADDADQMATKLDLARAYIDMGDSSGAKAILEEVAEKGTDDQQQEANSLLARIG